MNHKFSNKARFLSILLTFVLILSTFTAVTLIPASAAQIDVWDGTTVATAYAGGDGTEAKPYLISNGAQLARLLKNDIIDNTDSNKANLSKGKYYRLTADIYLNDVTQAGWQTADTKNSWYAATSSNRFQGSLDGNGYTIYGLYLEASSSAALFPYADSYFNDVVIKNVTLSDSYVKSTGANAGGLIGFSYSASRYRIKLYNCVVDETVTISETGDYYAGGLIGDNNSHLFYHR